MTDKPLSIVYVEDNPTSREVMEIMLKEMMGLSEVSIFADSADVVSRITALPYQPDIILLDIHMQPVDGFTILKELRQHPQFKTATVVAVTASVMNEEVALLKSAGFDGGIAKPIRPDQFPALLHRLARGEKVWHIA